MLGWLWNLIRSTNQTCIRILTCPVEHNYMSGKLALGGISIGGVSIAALIVALPEFKKAVEALALIPLFNAGLESAATGGDVTPYIIGMIYLLIVIALPIGILQALADA